VNFASNVFSFALMMLVSMGADCAPVVIVQNVPYTLGEVSNDPSICPRPDDSMTLSVTDEDKELTTYSFCSSYGKATAKIVTDIRGRSYVFLEYAEGHGTNATEDYLAVYGLAEDFNEYFRTPISAGVWPDTRWWYDYEIERPNDGGLRIEFTLDFEGEGVGLPNEKSRVISIDTPDH
jgi:hypothetical protein